MTDREVTEGLRSWVEQFDAMLAEHPEWRKFTAEQTSGVRLVVERGRVRLGRKGAWQDITDVMRPGLQREQGSIDNSGLGPQKETC